MNSEHLPLSADSRQRKADSEYFAVAGRLLQKENDLRQQAIADEMIKRARSRLMPSLGGCQRILLEEMLEDVALAAGLLAGERAVTDQRCLKIKPARPACSQSYWRELARRQDLNDAIEAFGTSINSYNPLFIGYLENYALYDPYHYADDSLYAVLGAIYGPNALETHLHPAHISDSGCLACVCQNLLLILECEDDEVKTTCLAYKERERDDWLCENMADT